jgi:hypothetical protein
MLSVLDYRKSRTSAEGLQRVLGVLMIPALHGEFGSSQSARPPAPVPARCLPPSTRRASLTGLTTWNRDNISGLYLTWKRRCQECSVLKRKAALCMAQRVVEARRYAKTGTAYF